MRGSSELTGPLIPMHAELAILLHGVRWETIQGAVIGLVAVLVLACGLAVDARSDDE